MCGGVIKKVHKLHVKGDPIFGKFLDKIPQSLGMPTVDEFADGLGMGGNSDSTDTTSTTTTQATNVASDVQSARDDEKRRRAAAAGMSSTILGGSTAGTATATKTLLGQ